MECGTRLAKGRLMEGHQLTVTVKWRLISQIVLASTIRRHVNFDVILCFW